MILCVIPARYGSTRLPAKPLAMIEGKPLVMWVYEAAVRSKVFDAVVVATDDSRIAEAVQRGGGEAAMTAATHERGTDRVWEVASRRAEQFVVNLQGDEPEIPAELLARFAQAVRDTIDGNSLLTCVSNAPATVAANPNVVKVVLNSRGEALYFSRAPIPHGMGDACVKHTGIYGFAREGLQRFCAMAPGVLERAEKLEQLRALENGMVVRCLFHNHDFCGIDTPEDLERFRQRARSLLPPLE
jgi:3-deoxy-manno-octulosonate cytidylyltransferase (CMP-KDO synthetase)